MSAPAFSPLDDYLILLGQLVRQPSVVGAERAFFRTLCRELDDVGVKLTQYEGLLVAEGTRPDSTYLSVHVDRHGLICTGPGEFQYAAFIAKHRADQLGNSVSYQTFGTLAGRFHKEAVEAYEPWTGEYLGRGIITDAYLCDRRNNVIFQVQGLDHVPPGTAVAYSDRVNVSGDLICAQLDNVVWVAAVVQMFRQGFQGTAFFTAQEEAGRSWRFVLEWFQRVDRTTRELFVLDTSPFDTREEADAQQVILRRRDANGIFDRELVDALERKCRQLEIPYRFKDAIVEAENERRLANGEKAKSLGSTELGRLVSASNGAIQGATIQIPTTGYHTASECTRLSSLQACMRLLGSVIAERNGETGPR
jgi:putative aminopeptidase FrvX